MPEPANVRQCEVEIIASQSKRNATTRSLETKAIASVTANPCLHAQLGIITPNIEVKIYQVPTSYVGGVAFRTILNGQTH